jgi:hypothetical protein
VCVYSVFAVVCAGSDRLCGLVVRVPGYRSRDTGFDFLGISESGTGSNQPRGNNYLNGKVAAPALENRD